MTVRTHLPSSNGQTATLAVVAMVLLAGCSFISATPEQTSPQPEDATADDSRTVAAASPTAKTTSTMVTTSPDQEPYPPGISETGLHNVTALLAAHTSHLVAAGFVANATVNTTVERSGFLVDVTFDGQTKVERNASAYSENRTITGGPVLREVDIWANESVEYRQRVEGAKTTFERLPPREPTLLAGGPLVGPFLRGGDYELEEEFESGDGKQFVLTATTFDNEQGIRRGLPDGATEIGSYDSTVVVDSEGRIRTFDARIGFLVGGENRTHVVHYDSTTLDNVSVERPEWVDDAASETNESDASEQRTRVRSGSTLPLEQVRTAIPLEHVRTAIPLEHVRTAARGDQTHDGFVLRVGTVRSVGVEP